MTWAQPHAISFDEASRFDLLEVIVGRETAMDKSLISRLEREFLTQVDGGNRTTGSVGIRGNLEGQLLDTPQSTEPQC